MRNIKIKCKSKIIESKCEYTILMVKSKRFCGC